MGSTRIPLQRTPLSLLERLRGPAIAADWERFVELYTPLLVAWARRLRFGDTEARDFVQDVFLTLIAKLPEFHHDGRGRFRAWLWTLTFHKARDLFRKKMIAPTPGLDPDLLATEDNVADWAEEDYRHHLFRQAIRIMQTDFAETTWRACWLCVVEDRSPDEVARTLGVSVESVYQAKSRVLRRLRVELDGLIQ